MSGATAASNSDDAAALAAAHNHYSNDAASATAAPALDSNHTAASAAGTTAALRAATHDNTAPVKTLDQDDEDDGMPLNDAMADANVTGTEMDARKRAVSTAAAARSADPAHNNNNNTDSTSLSSGSITVTGGAGAHSFTSVSVALHDATITHTATGTAAAASGGDKQGTETRLDATQRAFTSQPQQQPQQQQQSAPPPPPPPQPQQQPQQNQNNTRQNEKIAPRPPKTNAQPGGSSEGGGNIVTISRATVAVGLGKGIVVPHTLQRVQSGQNQTGDLIARASEEWRAIPAAYHRETNLNKSLMARAEHTVIVTRINGGCDLIFINVSRENRPGSIVTRTIFITPREVARVKEEEAKARNNTINDNSGSALNSAQRLAGSLPIPLIESFIGTRTVSVGAPEPDQQRIPYRVVTTPNNVGRLHQCGVTAESAGLRQLTNSKDSAGSRFTVWIAALTVTQCHNLKPHALIFPHADMISDESLSRVVSISSRYGMFDISRTFAKLTQVQLEQNGGLPTSVHNYKLYVRFPEEPTIDDVRWLGDMFPESTVTTVQGGRGRSVQPMTASQGPKKHSDLIVHLVAMPGRQLDAETISAAVKTLRLVPVTIEAAHAALRINDSTEARGDIVGTAFTKPAAQQPDASPGGNAGGAAMHPPSSPQPVVLAVVLSDEQWRDYNQGNDKTV